MIARNRILTGPIILLVALGLSGCLRLDYQATVGANDTMTGSFRTYTPIDVLREVKARTMGPDELIAQWEENTSTLVKDLSKQLESLDSPNEDTKVSVKDITDDELIGMEINFENLGFPKKGEKILPVGESALPGFSKMNIKRDGDAQILSGTLGMKAPETVEGLAAPGVVQAFAFQEQGKETTVSFSITFAGPIEETNGAVVGNTVTWVTPLFEPIKIQAKSTVPFQEGVGPEVSGGGGPNLMVIIITGLLVSFVLVGGYVFITDRRKKAAYEAMFGPDDDD